MRLCKEAHSLQPPREPRHPGNTRRRSRNLITEQHATAAPWHIALVEQDTLPHLLALLFFFFLFLQCLSGHCHLKDQPGIFVSLCCLSFVGGRGTGRILLSSEHQMATAKSRVPTSYAAEANSIKYSFA